MKIKVINLLVKIAKHEETPEMFEFQNDIYYKNHDDCNSYYAVGTNTTFMDTIQECDLNDYIKVLKEDKIIEHCKGRKGFLCIDDYTEYLKIKLDELIDEINNMKEGKE